MKQTIDSKSTRERCQKIHSKQLHSVACGFVSLGGVDLQLVALYKRTLCFAHSLRLLDLCRGVQAALRILTPMRFPHLNLAKRSFRSMGMLPLDRCSGENRPCFGD